MMRRKWPQTLARKNIKPCEAAALILLPININSIKIINLQAVYRFLRLFFLCDFEVI